MNTVEVFDHAGKRIGILTEAAVQVSNDRHAVGGGFVGGFYEEISPIEKGHYTPVTLKDTERTYHQCWVHAKTTLVGRLHAVFSFTYTEGAPLKIPAVSAH